MKHAITASLSAASLFGLAGAAPPAAQTMGAAPEPGFPYYGYPLGSGPTAPSHTGTPAYSWRFTGPHPAPNGECQIIAGNHVCFAGRTYAYGYGPGYAPPGGLIGAAVAAPVDAAGAIVGAPLAAAGALASAPVHTAGAIMAPAGAPIGYTVARRTGTPPYSYGSHVAPAPAVVGSCDIIAGNRVCTP